MHSSLRWLLPYSRREAQLGDLGLLFGHDQGPSHSAMANTHLALQTGTESMHSHVDCGPRRSVGGGCSSYNA